MREKVSAEEPVADKRYRQGLTTIAARIVSS